MLLPLTDQPPASSQTQDEMPLLEADQLCTASAMTVLNKTHTSNPDKMSNIVVIFEEGCELCADNPWTSCKMPVSLTVQCSLCQPI